MKKKFVLALFLTVLVNSWMVTSFIPSTGVKFKPVKNFDWLKEYYVFSRTVTTEGWTQHKQISFDSAGVVEVDRKKNPCTISEFALAAYNRYIQTKDPKFKEHFLTQVKWLINPSSYQLINENMLGHPYTYVFHDLKPPWYGGLAEAEFISVLIRYYSMTSDKNVLPLIIKTRNLLLTPEEKGGLLSKTPEGNIWIEEYGTSKQERHVLNGFFVTVISLYEYCRLFPDDIEAFNIYKECLESIKKSLKYYDRSNWVTYNRGDYRLVANWYMKAQVVELEELYRVSNDEFFKHYAMLWGTYPYEKPIGRAPGTCLIENYNFAVPMMNEGGKLSPQNLYSNILNSTVTYSYGSNVDIKKDSLRFLADGNANTKVLVDPMRLGEVPFYFEVNLDKEHAFDAVSVMMSANVKTVKFQALDGKGNLHDIAITSTENDAAYHLFHFNNMVKSLRLRLVILDFDPRQPVAINEIRLHNSQESQLPSYSFYQSEVIEVDQDSLTITFDTNDVADPVIFYKSAPDMTAMNKAVWTYDKFSKGTNIPIRMNDGKFFRFMVLCKIKSSSSSISNLTVQ